MVVNLRVKFEVADNRADNLIVGAVAPIENLKFPLKDGEQFAYGDSRADLTEPSDTFESLDEHPMMNTTREDFPEARKEDPAFLESHRVDQQDESAPHFRKDDPNQSEEAILINRPPHANQSEGQ